MPELTKARIEEIRRSGSCGLDDFDSICALALEALELREALEWMASDEVTMAVLFKVRVGYELDFETVGRDPSTVVGNTPLEAIQNARRGA